MNLSVVCNTEHASSNHVLHFLRLRPAGCFIIVHSPTALIRDFNTSWDVIDFLNDVSNFDVLRTSTRRFIRKQSSFVQYLCRTLPEKQAFSLQWRCPSSKLVEIVHRLLPGCTGCNSRCLQMFSFLLLFVAVIIHEMLTIAHGLNVEFYLDGFVDGDQECDAIQQWRPWVSTWAGNLTQASSNDPFKGNDRFRVANLGSDVSVVRA